MSTPRFVAITAIVIVSLLAIAAGWVLRTVDDAMRPPTAEEAAAFVTWTDLHPDADPPPHVVEDLVVTGWLTEEEAQGERDPKFLITIQRTHVETRDDRPVLTHQVYRYWHEAAAEHQLGAFLAEVAAGSPVADAPGVAAEHDLDALYQFHDHTGTILAARRGTAVVVFTTSDGHPAASPEAVLPLIDAGLDVYDRLDEGRFPMR